MLYGNLIKNSHISNISWKKSQNLIRTKLKAPPCVNVTFVELNRYFHKKIGDDNCMMI